MSSAWNVCAAVFSMLCKVATKYCHVLNAALNLVWYFGYLQLNRLQHCISYWISSCSDYNAASVMKFCYSQLKRQHRTASAIAHQHVLIAMLNLSWKFVSPSSKDCSIALHNQCVQFEIFGLSNYTCGSFQAEFPKKSTHSSLYMIVQVMSASYLWSWKDLNKITGRI